MFFGKESCKRRALTGQRGWAAVLLAIVFLCIHAKGTPNVTLAWNASSDPSVAGYFLYYGPAAGVYTNRIDIGNSTTTSMSGLNEGETYHFAVSAYNSTGAESGLSADIVYITPGLITLRSPVNPQAANLTFPVAPNHWYEIQASADMRTWGTIGQTGVATSNAWTQFTDTQSGQFTSRFYRLILH